MYLEYVTGLTAEGVGECPELKVCSDFTRLFNIFEIEQNLPVFVQSGEIFSDQL